MTSRILRCGALAAFSAAFFLAVQFVIALGVGSDISLLGSMVDPARMFPFLQLHARALTLLMTTDDAFAIAYGVAFVALALSVIARSQVLGVTALVLALATALTDLGENSLTLAVLATVAQKQTLDPNALVLLFWVGQMKYLLIYIAGLLFAVGIWGQGRTGNLFAVLLLLFPILGVASIAFEGLKLVQVLWMFILLLAGGTYLWRASSSEVSSI